MMSRLIVTMHLQLIFLIVPILNSFPNAQGQITQTDVCQNAGNHIALVVNHAGYSVEEHFHETGNLFYSPLSISMALGMAYLGAKGNTSRQMENALGYQTFNISGQAVHDSIKQLCEDIQGRANDFGYSLDIANALFSQVGWSLKDSFVQGVKNYYHGNASSLDFARHPEDATSFINDWTREKTSNKIEKLFDTPLSPNTRIVLANAIYFKGNWKIEFPEGRTYDGYFYINGTENRKQVQMMSLAEERFFYLKDQRTGYKYLELPYKGEQVSMLFALPLKFDQMPDLQMNADLLCRIQAQMVRTELEHVMIPKFKLSYEKDLKEILMAMGIEDAFSPQNANFSGINGENNLYISSVIHKAVIEVNEKGSEAAAITGIQMMFMSAREVDTSETFDANHPFRFYIIDKTSGTIVFSGKVIDP